MPVGFVDYIMYYVFNFWETVGKKFFVSVFWYGQYATQKWIYSNMAKCLYENREQFDSQGWNHDHKDNVFNVLQDFNSFI